jgi:hypothetical protein
MASLASFSLVLDQISRREMNCRTAEWFVLAYGCFVNLGPARYDSVQFCVVESAVIDVDQVRRLSNR